MTPLKDNRVKESRLVERVENELIRFRTSWDVGQPDAVVGFTGDLPLNTPIMFIKEEGGRIGWKLVKNKK